MRRVRRTPNFAQFMITGGVISFVIGAIVAARGDSAPGYSSYTSVALIGGVFAALGVLFGAIVALALEYLFDRD